MAIRHCVVILLTLIVMSEEKDANRKPYFMNSWSWEIREDAPIGFQPNSLQENVRLSAFDPDHDPLTFGVKGDIGERYFTVDGDVVKLKRQFDYEVDSTYRAKFFVTDGKAVVEEEAIIEVIDVNDNAPMFDRYPFEGVVDEDARIGTRILLINATDPDTGGGGVVRYYIENPQELPFTLNPVTGVLTLQNRLDFESTEVYQFKVKATDQDTQRPLSSIAQVIIRVRDVQDTNPVFLDIPYDRSIPENTPLRTTILLINARDGDTEHPRRIQYSIPSGDAKGNFMITGNNLRIATQNLDRDVEGFDGVYSLTVRATELGSRWAFTDLTFDITITDENDELPHWGEESYVTSVPEDTVVGSKLLTMSVEDLDQGANGEVAIFVDPRHASSFAVTPALCRGTCQVSLLLIKPLDYEDRKRIQLQVFANETQNSTHFATTTVIVNVENVNDNAPIFSKPVYVVNVPENATKNTVILSVEAEDGDEGEFGLLTYSISSQTFGIDITTGDVLLQGTLDGEEINQYSILVSASDGGYPPNRAMASVTIHITDINDNIPQFSAVGYSAEVNENVSPSKPIATISASDADAPPNNVITYDIMNTHFSHHFRIKKSNGGSGEVILREPLDFESIRGGVVRLEIIATDSGSPARNSTVPLVVTVVDINDHPPVFLEDSSVNISISETLGGGVKVGQVQATDRDEGKNKIIRYYVDRGGEEFDLIFRLNEYTGDITIKPGSSPDFERMSEYDVTIIAEDHGTPMLSARHKVLITIEDVNDNPPIFSQEKYVVTFDEGMTPVVARVTATDADKGVNGNIRYEITEGNDDGTFIINEESGEVIAISELDFETSLGEYKLVVTATDQSDNVEDRLSSEAQVIINVIDINDNPPVFQINAAPGQSIFYDVIEGVEGPRIDHFKAIDADAGKNGFISYSICKGNEKEVFSISHSGGDLRVRSGRSLDREESSGHDLVICATDAGDPKLNATLPVTVRVTDVNDNAPRFTKFHPVVRISEDAHVGIVVSRVTAHDLDDGEFGKFFYEITSGNHDGAFEIHKSSGVITLSKPLDRETVSKYDLEITVKDDPDSIENLKFTARSMKVIVTDVNDNTPRFIGKTPYHGRVEENSPIRTPVRILGDKLLAVDDDIGSNANISFSIIDDDVSFISNYGGGHQRKFFTIDSKTGVLRTFAEFDREVLSSDTIRLFVRASDRDRRHSDVEIVIQIGDVNDNSPRFRSDSLLMRVREDAKPGTMVTRVVATDKDVGQNSQITYRIENGAFDKFIITPDSGIIKVAPAQFLDREKRSVYHVTVVAMDNGIVTSLSSTCDVTIEIDDVNDSRPKFEDLQHEAQIKENSPPGTFIARVQATDSDLTSDLRYEVAKLEAFDAHGRQLAAGNRRSIRNDYAIIKSWFDLNTTSGEITAANTRKSHLIDRELCSRVEISVSVQDDNSTSGEVAEALELSVVTITIEDENDNSPVFVTSSFNGDFIELGGELIIDITEEAVIGSALVTLNAVDRDSGSNGEVIYDVIEGSTVQMRDQDSGTLIVASRIDHEGLTMRNGHAWVNATVLARDLGFPESRSKKLKVAMRIGDINDNEPVFGRRHYKVSVLENATIQSELLTVFATDPDSGSYGDVIYTLKGGRRSFSIRPISGKIHLIGALDRESTSVYNLVVTATDNQEGVEHNRRESSVPLTITVLDVNDCPPVFIEPTSPRTYSTQENSVVASFVAAVTAKDPDEGAGAQITYSLKKSRISSFFNIQPSSGHVTIRRALTALPRHLEDPKIEVVATDGGGLSSNMTLYLDIVDVNDHVPLFEEPEGKEISIYEEEPAGTKVGWMKATDTDSGLNGIIRYSFCDVTKNSGFLIDEVTGRIVTSQTLDRETAPEYILQVCANDLGVTSLRSSASVTIRLLDRNDNEPEFPKSSNIENGGGAYQVLHASEGLEVGQSIGHVMRAADRDTGANARVYYHLVAVFVNGRNDPGMFSLQRENRRIVLEKPLDREKDGKYKLIIRATNDEKYSLPTPITDEGKKEVVRRNVKQQKDVSMLGKGKGVSNSEITDSPEPLVMLSKATDEEASVTSPSTPSVASLLDPSRDPSLIVVAIVIDDVNDEWPVFEEKEYVSAADVEAKIGTEILKVKANDNDIGNNSVVTYTIINTFLRSHDEKTKRPVFGVFNIHTQDGAISTARQLESYEDGYFGLEIEAQDSASHQTTTIAYVYILPAKNKIKIVINSPPSTVREKKNEFLQVLGNITSSHVILDDDDVTYHVLQNGRRDNQRSDVTIRLFDRRTRQQVTPEELRLKLERNKKNLEKLFGACSVIQNNSSADEKDGSTLQIIVIIMLTFLFLIILIFSVLYYRMQRRYKRELEALAAGTIAQQSVKHLTSSEALLPPGGGGSEQYHSDTATTTAWKDDYYRRFSEQKISESDEFSSNDKRNRKLKVPVASSRTLSKSSSQETPQAKPRNRSETEKLKDPSLPRSRTEVWPSKGEKLPVPPEVLQQFMKEQRRRKRAEKKARSDRSRPGSLTPEEKNRWSLKQDTSSLKRSGISEDSSSTIRGSEDSRSDSTVITETKPKNKDKKKPKKDKPSPSSREVKSPELSLHSGGNSEDLARKHSMTLHGSDVSEHSLKDYLDSDVTSTNMTSSSPSHFTSSISSFNQISDL